MIHISQVVNKPKTIKNIFSSMEGYLQINSGYCSKANAFFRVKL